jgi:hypothetical protein
MKRPVYQQIAMELKDLRYQQEMDRENGIHADFSIVLDLQRNIYTLVDMYLPSGTTFEFSSFTNRMYFRGDTHTCTVEATLTPGVDISVKAHNPLRTNDPCDEEVLYQFTKSLMKEVPC